MISNKANNILLTIVVLLLATPCLWCSESCDSLIRKAVEFSDKQNYAQSMATLLKARQIAEKEKSAEAMFWILTNIGINHAELLNYDGAMQNFMEAYKIASEKLDRRKQLSILNNIAGLYMIDKKYEKSKEYYLNIFRQIKDSGDSLIIGGCAINIATTSMLLHDYDEAFTYIKIAEKMVGDHPAERLKLVSKKVEYLLNTRQSQEAYNLAATTLQQARRVGNQSLYEEITIIYVRTCLNTKRIKEAENAAVKLLQSSQSLKNREELFSLLSEIYTDSGLYKKALAYKDSTLSAIARLHDIESRKHFESSQIQFELAQREKEIEEYEMRQKTNITITILALIIAVVLTWALINRTVKNRQKQKILELERDKEKNDRQLLQNKLEEEQRSFNHEIEMKGRELVSNALVLANRNDKIQEIVAAISESETIRKANDSRVNRSVKELQKSLDVKQDWKQFTTYFEQVNSEFINALHQKYPDLTANEIRFLSLVFINLSTKEIALLLSITPEYCKKKKQQIAHKIGIETTKQLYCHLHKIGCSTI